MASQALIAARSLAKRYGQAIGGQSALVDASFDVAAGEMVVVAGRSGAGKTTLLKLIAAIERPTGGSLFVSGQNLSAVSDNALPYVRRNIGIVFQDQKLLFDRSALENVLLPLDIVGEPRRDALRRAQAALDKVGLLVRQNALPAALSGGEQQRLAIARAVVNRPAVILADEPTANLDTESAEITMNLFRAFHQVGTTVLVATHDAVWAGQLGARLIRLDGGRTIA
jgi:cell division transport system ATP-binding protein